MKTLIKRALRAAGYELRPIALPSAEPFAADPAEAAELDDELRAFARDHPGHGAWSRPESARSYLSPRRLAFFRDLLDRCRGEGVALEGRSVADVGSGTGYLLRLIHRAAPTARLTGFDTYADITALARHLCPAARFVERDLDALDEGPFDLVFCTEVLEHLVDPAGALERLLGLLDAGGDLVLTVPDGRRDSFGALEPYENGRGYWGHINFWSPESWSLFIAAHAGGRRWRSGQLVTGENYAIVSG